MDIPEYYRKYQSETPPPKPQEPTQPQAAQPPTPSRVKPPDQNFQANQFTLNLYDGWQDQTIYTLTGPVTDGIQHNIIVNIENGILSLSGKRKLKTPGTVGGHDHIGVPRAVCIDMINSFVYILHFLFTIKLPIVAHSFLFLL